MPFRSHLSRIALAGSLAIAAVAFAQNQSTPYPPRGADAPRAENPSRDKRADLMGRVATVSPDGRSITLSMTPRSAPEAQPPPRDARPEQATFMLTDHSQVSFFGIGEGEAKPAPGLMAMVWLEEG